MRPVSLWRKRLPGYAAMGAATVAMAVGLIAMQHARTTVAGTLLQVSEADAAAYGISAVYQLDNGSYRVEGSQKGFESDVQAAVTLDAEGNVSAVEILSQAETDSLGLQLILNCLFALSNDMYSQTHIKTAFEMRLMSLAGYEPNLMSCCVCGSSEPELPRFSPRNGVICCRECNNAQVQANYELCPASLQALRYIVYAPARKMLSFKIDDDALSRASKATEAYLLTQTERKFSTLDYWRQIK